MNYQNQGADDTTIGLAAPVNGEGTADQTTQAHQATMPGVSSFDEQEEKSAVVPD